VECFGPASPLFHLGFAGSHQREPAMSAGARLVLDFAFNPQSVSPPSCTGFL